MDHNNLTMGTHRDPEDYLKLIEKIWGLTKDKLKNRIETIREFVSTEKELELSSAVKKIQEVGENKSERDGRASGSGFQC